MVKVLECGCCSRAFTVEDSVEVGIGQTFCQECLFGIGQQLRDNIGHFIALAANCIISCDERRKFLNMERSKQEVVICSFIDMGFIEFKRCLNNVRDER